jgi:hypothetical protein
LSIRFRNSTDFKHLSMEKMNLTWKSRLLELDHIVLCPSSRERS